MKKITYTKNVFAARVGSPNPILATLLCIILP